jgi:uncharacterized membrane protein
MPIQNIFHDAIAIIAVTFEVAGILTICLGAAVATFRYLRTPNSDDKTYETYRANLGRSILLGLEWLVAGDIIHTVTLQPSFESLGILSIIVVIRTFLSFSLQVEIKGRWPWHGSQ